MRNFMFLFTGLIFYINVYSASVEIDKKPPKILVFSKTTEHRHESINEGKKAFLKMGLENKWIVDTTEDASVFNNKNLFKYKVVIFLNTTGNVLDSLQQLSFQKYIKNGGSFVGIHGAADTEKEWPWYNGLVGAYFKSHPTPQEAWYHVVNKSHPAVIFMPDSLRRFEEIYNFYSFKKDLVNVILTVDEKTYSGGNMPGYHPISWCHSYQGGKAFYTAWGHHPETFSEKVFLKHILGGIKWALK